MNPFRHACAVDGEYFCPRPELERQLRSFAESGQNVVVHGDRRAWRAAHGQDFSHQVIPLAGLILGKVFLT